MQPTRLMHRETFHARNDPERVPWLGLTGFLTYIYIYYDQQLRLD